MRTEELSNNIIQRLMNNKSTSINVNIDDVEYNISFIAPNKNNNINIPSIIIIPKTCNINNQLVVETNNLETNDLTELLPQAINTGTRLAKCTYPSPVVIPLIPSERNGPYYQQLSKECFNLESTHPYYRIDEQVVRIINQAKKIIFDTSGIKCDDRIFLNGYSSSGVFAQRFALIHPELIETACIGGASGSIPIPLKDLGYPMGIADYEKLFNKPFDIESYRKIKFRYYLAELESKNKTETRFDESGNPAPMHDMSYHPRSTGNAVGGKYREIFGTDLVKRVNNIMIELLKDGVNINHFIIPERTHSDNKYRYWSK